MCGIVGFANLSQSPADSEIQLQRMLDSLQSRGPDDSGFWSQSEASIYFGHRRLAIIDIENAVQPMRCPHTNCVLIFNGEIYNYKKLRPRLEDMGYKFSTNSDTEVLLAAYVIWGKDLVHELDGIFAFAIYDPRAGEIFLARDHFGVKPLYFTYENGGIRFSSELRSLGLFSNRTPELCPKGVTEYLVSGYTIAPQTVLKDIFQIPAGTLATWSVTRQALSMHRYFDLASSANGKAGRNLTQREAEEQTAIILEKTVRDQLVADVPIATFLSGGTDSSLLSYFAARATNSNIEALSISFSDPEFDESRGARKVASHLGIRHQSFPCDIYSMQKDWRDYIWQTDAPIFDVSFPPMRTLCKGARERYKVAISGDGGDELFLGYQTYGADWLKQNFDRVPLLGSVFHHSFRMINPRVGKVSASYKLGTFARHIQKGAAIAHGHWRELLQESTQDRLLLPEFRRSFEEAHPSLKWEQIYKRAPGADPLTRMSYLDIETWLANDILVKTDRASMGFGLEVRVPFLSRNLAEFAMGLPDRRKYSLTYPKRILRNLVNNYIPEDRRRYHKKGFSAPIGIWLKHDMYHEALEELSKDSPLYDLIDQKEVLSLLSEHRKTKVDYGYGLWAILVLNNWFRELQTRRRVYLSKINPMQNLNYLSVASFEKAEL